MTFEEDITSNECNTKEITSFEDILHEQFKKYEQDWDGLERVLDKFHKLEQEKDMTTQLYQGDCIEQLKNVSNNSVNLILTDPPYNIARKNNFHTMGRAGIDFGGWDKGFDLFSYIKEIPRVLHKDGSVIIFNDWKNIGEIARCCEENGLVIKDMLRWEKLNPMPRNKDRRYITDYEVAVWVTNTKAKWTFNPQADTYDRPKFVGSLTPGKEKTGHTTQKPVYLMEQLLKIHSNPEDVVLDMFMGSGTTGVACKNLGRKFIGIELDETYFNIAKERIETA